MQMHQARDKMGDRRWSRERGRGEGEMSFPCLIDLNRISDILAGSSGLKIVLVAKIMQAFCLPHSTIRPLTNQPTLHSQTLQVEGGRTFSLPLYLPPGPSPPKRFVLPAQFLRLWRALSRPKSTFGPPALFLYSSCPGHLRLWYLARRALRNNPIDRPAIPAPLRQCRW